MTRPKYDSDGDMIGGAERCPHCGDAMQHDRAEPENDMPERHICTPCGMTYYPSPESWEVDGVAANGWTEAAKMAAEFVEREKFGAQVTRRLITRILLANVLFAWAMLVGWGLMVLCERIGT